MTYADAARSGELITAYFARGSEMAHRYCAASIGLWLTQWLIWWWMAEALLRGWRQLLGPWWTGFAVPLLVAAATNLGLWRYTTPLVTQAFATLSVSPEAGSFPDLDRDLADPHYVWTLVKSGWLGTLYWIALRAAYEAWPDPLPVPRPMVVCPAPVPDVLTRVPGAADRGDVVALKAEDHYVRVHFSNGSLLPHHRFTDAVDAMREVEGAQVHRSCRVRGAAVAQADFLASSAVLALTNGLCVPISQRHRALVQQMLRRRATLECSSLR